ncbi:MAG: hypothetical protein M3Y55_19045, partial [Pseudomonadota bacterium]|nr:hypothetical protein [Pseudomonadota bacterium]
SDRELQYQAGGEACKRDEQEREQAAHVSASRIDALPLLRTKVLDQSQHREDEHRDTEQPADRHPAHHPAHSGSVHHAVHHADSC